MIVLQYHIEKCFTYALARTSIFLMRRWWWWLLWT